MTLTQNKAGVDGNTDVGLSNWNAICTGGNLAEDFSGGEGGFVDTTPNDPSFFKGVGSALVLNPLLHHRNGPYQHPSWKQIRGGEHPVMRHLKKRSVLSIAKERKHGTTKTEQKFGELSGQPTIIYNYIEPSITSKFKPLVHKFDIKQFAFDKKDDAYNERSLPSVALRHTYANNLCTFTYNKKAGFSDPTSGNHLVDDDLLIHDLIGFVENRSITTSGKVVAKSNLEYPEKEDGTQIYTDLKHIYLDEKESIAAAHSPINSLIYMEYPEVVFPKEHLTFRSKMRRRLNYAEKESELVPFERRTFWANGALEGTKCDVDDSSCDTLEEAQAIADATAGIRPTASINSQGFEVGANRLKFAIDSNGSGPESVWPLAPLGELNVDHRSTALRQLYDVSSGLITQFTYHTSSANYTHTLPYHRYADLEDWTWRAGEQSGNSPWYESYEDYSEEMRAIGKDYGLIPEFRISDHMSFYAENEYNFYAQNKAIFTIFGAGTATGSINNKSLPVDASLAGFATTVEGLGVVTGATASADYATADFNHEFFKTYTHTDFMKYFEIIFKEHKAASVEYLPADENSPGYEKNYFGSSMKMTCHALKKLLPYNGFYPVNRTLQLASLFNKAMTSGKPYEYPVFCRSGSAGVSMIQSSAGYEAILQPFFSPGIMYNTIKSGIAVDWPIFIGARAAASAAGRYAAINQDPNMRLPFEALYEPERHLPSAFSGGGDTVGQTANKQIFHAYPNLFSGSSVLYANLGGVYRTVLTFPQNL